jgi:hypothetical protein
MTNKTFKEEVSFTMTHPPKNGKIQINSEIYISKQKILEALPEEDDKIRGSDWNAALSEVKQIIENI